MSKREWMPINGCSHLKPHTDGDEQWMNDEMNADHADPTVPFKTDWAEGMWGFMSRCNGLTPLEETVSLGSFAEYLEDEDD